LFLRLCMHSLLYWAGVCLLLAGRISQQPHGRTLSKYACMLTVAVAWSILWQHCHRLFASGFVDNVTFSHNGPYAASCVFLKCEKISQDKSQKWRIYSNQISLDHKQQIHRRLRTGGEVCCFRFPCFIYLVQWRKDAHGDHTQKPIERLTARTCSNREERRGASKHPRVHARRSVSRRGYQSTCRRWATQTPVWYCRSFAKHGVWTLPWYVRSRIVCSSFTGATLASIIVRVV